MTPRNFVWLALAAIVSTVLAIASWSARNSWSDATVAGAKLMPALTRDADKVAGLVIQQGDKTLKLARTKDGKGWMLADRAGFPADAEKVRGLLLALSESQLVEPKTKVPGRYDLIDLDDPTKAGAKSELVRLTAADGSTIAEAVLGKTRMDAFGSGKVGTYVRRPGEVQTWLATGEMDPAATIPSWVKTSVLALDAATFTKLTLNVPGEAPLIVARKDGKVAFVDLAVPEGKKLKRDDAADNLMRAAGTIDLDDVRKLDPPPSGTDVSTLSVDGKDGLTLTIRVRKDGKDSWLSVEAAGATEASKKVADEITQRTKGWEYKLHPVKAESLVKKRADLFEAKSS
jgi:hypothetical protein